MKQKHIALTGLLHALGAAAYIALVTFVMTHASRWFGEKDTPLSGMAALMLLVLSAAVMASLTFLRPALWYLSDKKREALRLLGWTLIFFFVLTVIVFLSLAIVR